MRRTVVAIFLPAALWWSGETFADTFVDPGQGKTPPGSVVTDQGESKGELRLWYSEGGDRKFKLTEQRTWFDVAWGNGFCEGTPNYLLKNELSRTVATQGHHVYATIDRLKVSVTPVGEAHPAISSYILSLTPELHAEGNDTVDVAFNGGYLAIQVGDDPYRNFDPASGTLLFRSDDPGRVTPIGVEGDPTFRNAAGQTCYYDRLVGLTEHGAAAGVDRIFVLGIDYASASGILQHVHVETVDRGWLGIKDPESNACARIVRPNTMGDVFVLKVPPHETDADTFDRIAIWIQLDESRGIEIPISKDRLDVSKAALPEGFFLVSE